jgi:hypothetical protein
MYTYLAMTRSSIQRTLGPASPGVKRSGREADHSLPNADEVKNKWSHTSAPPCLSRVQEDSFTDLKC